jgi:hypothetical protein
MINWSIEWPEIQQAAAEYCVDPMFVAAIRHAENGEPGIEFGVEDRTKDTFELQLRECCASVRNRVMEFPRNPFSVLVGPNVKRLVYGSGFVAYFQSKWAPTPAGGPVENDPNNLNANWYKNVTEAYLLAVRQGKLG